MSEKILLVDDDPNVLAGYTRQLRKQFELETAQGGDQGLGAIASRGPFAVVVTDMRMPGLSGLEFLRRVRIAAPSAVRMMLTGNADQQTAVDAVNEGSVFRFLTKPCPPEVLAGALRAGLEHYRLAAVEKELLEETLRGSVRVLTEVLSLACPVAFGRASRAERTVRKLAAALGVEDAWRLEVAAMLSQIGCVAVTETVLDKVYRGAELAPQELQMFERHPETGRGLLAKVPRLEAVAEIIAYQEKRFDGGGPPAGGKAGEAIPLGARVLKVVLDHDSLESVGDGNGAALRRMRGRAGWYDPRVLEALEQVCREATSYVSKEVAFHELAAGMILREGVFTAQGVVLVGKAQQITDTLLARLQNASRHGKVREPIPVLAPVAPGNAPDGTPQ